MTEIALKSRIIKAIKKRWPGIWLYKTMDSGTLGLPDLVICFLGHFVAIELKTPQNKKGATQLQEWQIKRIREAGGHAAVLRSVECVIAWMEELEQQILNQQGGEGHGRHQFTDAGGADRTGSDGLLHGKGHRNLDS